MTHSIRLLLVACLLSGTPSWGSLLIQIPSPQDDVALKYALWEDPKIAPDVETDRKFIRELEEILRTMKESEIKNAFGPPTTLDFSYVLPFSRHTAVGFSGLGYKGNEEMYFLPIEDIGGVLVFPLGDRDYISAVALYLKTDGAFVPLKTPDNVAARRTWDHQRLSELANKIKKN